MSSKVVSLIFLSLAIAYANSAVTESHPTKADEVSDKCGKENNVNSEEINKQWKEGTLSETEDVKCFLACFMNGMGMIQDGKFSREEFGKIAELKWKGEEESIEKAKEIHRKCIEKIEGSENNICSKAYNMSKCLTTESDKVGLKRRDW